MSILEGKSVLIIGDLTGGEHHELELVLKKQRMHVSKAACETVSMVDIEKNRVDVVLVNHLHSSDACTKLLDDLREKILNKNVSIFALVEDTQENIKEVLLLGVTDYITLTESNESIVKKIKLVFGHPDNFSSASILEVPSDTAVTTKKGIKVFVVEDDSLLRNLLSTKLEASSFPAVFSADGSDVIRKIQEFKPQVIILDLMLPVKNGFEILAELKAHSQLKSIPVIIFSNRDSQEDKQRVFQLGADRYFVKAMTDLSILIETIEELAG
jgi:DNA-binding response OmpR family regulator